VIGRLILRHEVEEEVLSRLLRKK